MTNRGNGNPHWTADEEKTLSELWQAVSPKRLLEALPRRTWCAISRRAWETGLPRGVPNGCMSVARAAKRFGYEWTTFVRIMKWAGVKVGYCYPNCHGDGIHRKRTRHNRYVDTIRASEGVDEFLESESTTEAGLRLGINRDLLLWRLRVADALDAKKMLGGYGFRWRPGEVEAALKKYDALPHGQRHAKPVEIARRTQRKPKHTLVESAAQRWARGAKIVGTTQNGMGANTRRLYEFEGRTDVITGWCATFGVSRPYLQKLLRQMQPSRNGAQDIASRAVA